jgi:hypothetical protein
MNTTISENPPQVPAAKPKKRKRVFLWVFLAVQALFVIWIITGVIGNSGSGAAAHAQAVASCSGTQWQVLYKSAADCVTSLGNTYNAASDAGTGIGAGLVIALWVATDVILGTGRLIVVLSRRH